MKISQKAIMVKVMKDIFFEVDVHNPENLHNLRNDSPFLPERMKIEKVKKLAANLHVKTDSVIHIRNLKEALKHELVLKKVQIKFNQEAW